MFTVYGGHPGLAQFETVEEAHAAYAERIVGLLSCFRGYAGCTVGAIDPKGGLIQRVTIRAHGAEFILTVENGA